MANSLIFVRQKVTSKFLKRDGGWSIDFNEARPFKSTWEAVDVCCKRRVHRAEIVLRLGDPHYDVLLDVA